MPHPKTLTKRQLEVIKLLTAAPGRHLASAKGGYLSPVEADGTPVDGVRAVAPIVADALTRAGLLNHLRPTLAARELFGDGIR